MATLKHSSHSALERERERGGWHGASVGWAAVLICETERERERVSHSLPSGCWLLPLALGGQMMPLVGLKWRLKSNMYKLV